MLEHLKTIGNPLRTLAVALLAIALVLANAVSSAPANAQPNAQANAARFDQRTLDELLVPIALYPDALLTQVLIASTYPLDVVQAARFVDRSRDLAPDALAAAAETQPWDPSVIALVRFPSVLAMMDDKLDWTQKLGEAFLAQQADVMDTVQALRARAQAAGNLSSNAQQTVVVQERVIVIEPAQPQVVYVPFFNPVVVYGSWWWPGPPRWVWQPPVWRPGWGPGWGPVWGPGWGSGWGPGIGWGPPVVAPPWIWHGRAPNWHNRNIVINNTVVNNNTVVVGNPTVWTHGSRGGVTRPGERSAYPLPVSTPANPRGSDRAPLPDARHPAQRPAAGVPPLGAPPALDARPGARPAPQRPDVRPPPGVPTLAPAGPATSGHPPAATPPAAKPPAAMPPATKPPAAMAPVATPPGPMPPGATPPAAARPAPRPAPQPDATTGGTPRAARSDSGDRADRDTPSRPGTSTPSRATP